MTSHISPEDYENFMKVLQANSSKRSSQAGTKSFQGTNQKANVLFKDEGINRQKNLTGVERIKAELIESDSDSGYSKSLSSSGPDSSFSLASSGTSVDSGLLQRDDDGPLRELSFTSEVNHSNVELQESLDTQANSASNGAQSSESHDAGNKKDLEEEKNVSTEIRDATKRKQDGGRVTTPSTVFQKRENRQRGMEAGGVGSFTSFTSPSELFEKGQVKNEVFSEDNQSIGEDIAIDGHSESSQQEEDDEKLEYSTPSQLLMKRENRLEAEQAAGVGSFESFTSPSALFKKKQILSISEMDGGELNKSSSELLHINEDPSEILKKKTGQIVLERIASAIDDQTTHGMLGEGSEETDTSVERKGTASEDEVLKEEGDKTKEMQTGIDVDDIKVKIQDDSVVDDIKVKIQDDSVVDEDHKGKVTFQEKGCIPGSSESDISLILEDGKDHEECSSSDITEQEEQDLVSERHDAGMVRDHQDRCRWHTSHGTHRVLKTRSYPLMHLTRSMLCCDNDPIQCECFDKESVEKLVEIDGDSSSEQELEEDSSNVEKHHSWADATWRSLEMVIQRQHAGSSEKTPWEPPDRRIIKNNSYTSPDMKQKSENQDPELLERMREELKSMKEELDSLRELKTEKDWSMMEEKLQMSRKLLQQQREREEEKTHLVHTHHKIVDEMMEKHQITKTKVKEQEKEITILREKVHRGDEAFHNECMEMERRWRAWHDCKANMEEQLILADEENSNFRRLQKENTVSMEVMRDKINSLTVGLNRYKSECERLENALSELKQQPSTKDIVLHSINTTPSVPPTETAHANISIELDEVQNKLTIETQLDRKFVCGDGTKTNEEIQEITDNLTMFIKDEVVQNLFPLLYERDKLPERDSNQNIPLSGSTATPERSHEAEAAVIISLDAKNDTRVKIHAEMDAGFLGAGRKEEEVNDVIQAMAKYIKDHFLERILLKLFPDKDQASLFAISSEVSSSSLHNLSPISESGAGRLLMLPCNDNEKDKAIIDSAKVAEKQSVEIERLEASLEEANAAVTALQGVVRKQEVDYAKLEERFKRRETQLKDVCCQFTENERQWMEEKDALGQKLKVREADVEVLQSQLDEIRSDKETLSDELHEKIRDLTDSEYQLKMKLEEKEKDLIVKDGKIMEMMDSLNAKSQASLELKHNEEELARKLNEKQEELVKLTSQFESIKLGLEEQLRCYEVVLKEKDDTIAKLSTLQVGEGSNGISGIKEKIILEQLVSSLKTENMKLRSHLKNLAPSGLQLSPVKTTPHTKQETLKFSDNVTVPWEQYHEIMGEKNELSVMLNQLQDEKQNQMIWSQVLEEKVTQFQSEIKDLKKKISSLTGDLEKAIKETQGLKQRLVMDEMRADLKFQTKLREVESCKEKTERNLKERMMSLNMEKGQLVSERNHWQEDVRLLKEEKKTLLEQLEECNKKLGICQNDLKEATVQLQVKEADLKGANSQIEEMKKGREISERKLGDLYQELMKAQADVERTQESKKRDVDVLQSQISFLEKDLLSSKENLEEAQNKLIAVKSELENKTVSHKMKIDTIEKLQQEKDIIKAQISALEEKVKLKETGAFAITDSLMRKQEEVDYLQNRLFVQSSELVRVKDELAEKSKLLEQERNRVESLSAERKQLIQENDERVDDIHHIEEKYSVQEEKLTDCRRTIEELQKENGRLQNELENAEREKEELNNSIEDLQQQYQTIYEKHTRLDCKSESDSKFSSFLQEELEKSKTLIDRLKDRTRELKKEVEVKEEVYNEEEEHLKRALSESRQEVSRLQKELKDAHKSAETLQETGKEQADRVKEAQDQIASLTTDLEQLQKEFMAEKQVVQRLGEEKDEIRAQLDEKIEKLINEKNSLLEEVFQAKLSAKVGRVKHGQVGSQLKHLRQCVDEQIENSIKNVEQTTALKKDIERLQEENAGLQDTISRLKETENQREKELADKKKEICDLSLRLNQAEHQDKTYQCKIEELEVLLQNERMLVESLKKVTKEKKKRWLLNNQLFSSKFKTQLQTEEEKIAQLQDDLAKANHEGQLQRCEISEKIQVIEGLQDKITLLEDNQSGLEVELRQAVSHLRKEKELVKILNERLQQCHEEMKSNLKQKWEPCNKLSCPEHISLNSSDFELETKSMYNRMKLIEAEMKKNITEEVKDHVMQIKKQISPNPASKDPRLEDIALEISKMKQQRQWEKDKMESIAMNIDKLNLSVQNEMRNFHQKKCQNVRSHSTPEEISHAIKVANMRALSRAHNSHASNCACSRDQTDTTSFIGPEASVFNDSTILAGSADLFHSAQRQPCPSHISATKNFQN